MNDPTPPVSDARVLNEAPRPGMAPPTVAPRRASWMLMWQSPLHLLSLGFGSGLSPVAPGTVGTLWAWLSFAVLSRWLGEAEWALLIGASLPLGWCACTRTAQALGSGDPGAIVWDEIVAFWIMLWLVTPASLTTQCVAFVLFRFFDAVKPGPVAWADGLFKGRPGQPPGRAQGFGILFDDLVAALCALLVMALWKVN